VTLARPLGRQRAGGNVDRLGYATTLDVPFVFSSNGDGFVFHDRTGGSAQPEVNLGLDAFPSPADLWARYSAWKGLTGEAEQIVLQDYFADPSGRAPRYYQVNAVNAAIEAIAKGQDRLLLVMATGTGKTYTAFQIIWRLWKAGRKKRILYLADRNILIDQTMVNDFRPFGGVMAKLSTGAKTIERSDGSDETLTSAIDPGRQINKSYEIYLGLYQAVTGPDERQKLFREFPFSPVQSMRHGRDTAVSFFVLKKQSPPGVKRAPSPLIVRVRPDSSVAYQHPRIAVASAGFPSPIHWTICLAGEP
jgi:type I site-specific restriction endonuclease